MPLCLPPGFVPSLCFLVVSVALIQVSGSARLGRVQDGHTCGLWASPSSVRHLSKVGLCLDQLLLCPPTMLANCVGSGPSAAPGLYPQGCTLVLRGLWPCLGGDVVQSLLAQFLSLSLLWPLHSSVEEARAEGSRQGGHTPGDSQPASLQRGPGSGADHHERRECRPTHAREGGWVGAYLSATGASPRCSGSGCHCYSTG